MGRGLKLWLLLMGAGLLVVLVVKLRAPETADAPQNLPSPSVVSPGETATV